MKKTIFNNNDYTINKETEARLTDNDVRQNLKTIHSIIVQTHLNNRPPNKLLNRPPPKIDKTEETLPHSTRRRLSQLRANKSPLLMTYLHKINEEDYPSPTCPLCNSNDHDTGHLFNWSTEWLDDGQPLDWSRGCGGLAGGVGGEVGLAPSCGGLGPRQSSLSGWGSHHHHSIDISITNVGQILTKLRWFQLFVKSQNSNFELFWKKSNFGFRWCSTREDLSIDVSITNGGLILTKLRWFQLFVKSQNSNFLEKKIKFLGFHGVVLVKTFPLMYQLLM